jgi:hypothetical protein
MGHIFLRVSKDFRIDHHPRRVKAEKNSSVKLRTEIVEPSRNAFPHGSVDMGRWTFMICYPV